MTSRCAHSVDRNAYIVFIDSSSHKSAQRRTAYVLKVGACVKRFVALSYAQVDAALPTKAEAQVATNHAIPPVVWTLAFVALGRPDLTLCCV